MSALEDDSFQGGSAHAGGPGSYGAYTFSGVGISIIAFAGPSLSIDGRVHKTGGLKISIDGHLKAETPLRTESAEYGYSAFSQLGLSPGYHVLQVEAENGWAAVDGIVVVKDNEATSLPLTITPSPGEFPYDSVPAAIPGVVYLAKYDLGGQNVAYYDTTPGNSGQKFRKDDVDIEDCNTIGCPYDVGVTAPGEWLKYTVNVENSGVYKLTFRVASKGEGRMHMEDEAGLNLTGPIYVPSTGGWQTWQDISGQVHLRDGKHVLKLCLDTGSYNLATMRFQ